MRGAEVVGSFHGGTRCGVCVAAVAIMLAAMHASGQTTPVSGRFSLFGDWASRTVAGNSSSDLSDVIATLSLRPTAADPTVSWALDARVADYPSAERDTRISIYEAWVGVRSASGAWRARLGQLWLTELGGLGNIGGAQLEYLLAPSTAAGRLRVGAFAGLEPKRLDAGWVKDVKKGGVYVALDGDHGRKHVLGWVLIRNGSLTERSVVTLSNFVPVGRTFFLYQAAELDLQGPGRLGTSELTYLLVNMHWVPVRAVDLQATYHRGVSIDARGLTEDQLAGRPVDPAALVGLLYESSRFRVSVRPLRWLTVWAGAGHDRNNRGDPASNRLNLGLSARNFVGTGLDISVSKWTSDKGIDGSDSLYVSLGRSFGSRVYVSLDYNQALAVYHLRSHDGGIVEVRPDSRRYALAATVTLSRRWAILLDLERLDQQSLTENRLLAGLTLRF